MTEINEIQDLEDTIREPLITAPTLERKDVTIYPVREPVGGFSSRSKNIIEFIIETGSDYSLPQDAYLTARVGYYCKESITFVGVREKGESGDTGKYLPEVASTEKRYDSFIEPAAGPVMLTKVEVYHGPDLIQQIDKYDYAQEITHTLTANSTNEDVLANGASFRALFSDKLGHACSTIDAAKDDKNKADILIPLNNLFSEAPIFPDHQIFGKLRLVLTLTSAVKLSYPRITISKLRKAFGKNVADSALSFKWTEQPDVELYYSDVTLVLPTLRKTGPMPLSNRALQTQTLTPLATNLGPIDSSIKEHNIPISRNSIKYLALVALNPDAATKIVRLKDDSNKDFSYVVGAAIPQPKEPNNDALYTKGSQFLLANISHETCDFTEYHPYMYYQLRLTNFDLSLANNDVLPGRKTTNYFQIYNNIMSEFHNYSLNGGVPHKPKLRYATVSNEYDKIPVKFTFGLPAIIDSNNDPLKKIAIPIAPFKSNFNYSNFVANTNENDIGKDFREVFYNRYFTVAETSVDLKKSAARKSILFFPFTKKPGSGRTIMSGIDSGAATLKFTIGMNKIVDWSPQLELLAVLWTDGVATIGGPGANIQNAS